MSTTPTVSKLRGRLGLFETDAKCLRRLIGAATNPLIGPHDCTECRPYFNRNLVPAVLTFACWAMGSKNTATVLVPDRGTGPEFLSDLLYDRVAQLVVVKGCGNPSAQQATLFVDHSRYRFFLGTWDDFWRSATWWMGTRAEARVVCDTDGPATEHSELIYGNPNAKLTLQYVTDPFALAPGPVSVSEAGYQRIRDGLAEPARTNRCD